MVLAPLLKPAFYERTMSLPVVVGIAASSGSITFIMIPRAFDESDISSSVDLSKSWLILGALHGSFTVGRILQFLVELKRTKAHENTLKPTLVAYMIIFGSSANNFVDGMSNGVAFADSLVRGLNVGLACIAQQFPQELGTLAILVRSGLGLKKTLLLNLIPATLSYSRFVIGAIIDDVSEGFDKIAFAISSGMYLYILLGTLISDIREAFGEMVKTDLRKIILTTMLQFLEFQLEY
uniref:Aa_trans domain-containing protein n=1 Tax=Syphacia muris TaxID=451379 RepID=A0A0N5A7V1_9BILA